MSALNLPAALELYDLLKPYLPEDTNSTQTVLEYIEKMFHKISENDSPEDYFKAISMMTGLSVDDLMIFSTDELLTAFIEGLSENRIEELRLLMEGFDA